MGLLVRVLHFSLLQACSAQYGDSVNLLDIKMMRYPTYENILNYQHNHRHHHREKRQSIKGSSNIHDVVELDDTETFHGPNVLLPEVSFRDMDSFVAEAQNTIDERFEKLEKEIYRSSARQVPGTPEWFMAASTKTKVVAKNISRIALISEEATKYLAQKYQLTRDQITFGLPTADVRGTVLGDVCPVKVDFPCQVRAKFPNIFLPHPNIFSQGSTEHTTATVTTCRTPTGVWPTGDISATSPRTTETGSASPGRTSATSSSPAPARSRSLSTLTPTCPTPT